MLPTHGSQPSFFTRFVEQQATLSACEIDFSAFSERWRNNIDRNGLAEQIQNEADAWRIKCVFNELGPKGTKEILDSCTPTQPFVMKLKYISSYYIKFKNDIIVEIKKFCEKVAE